MSLSQEQKAAIVKTDRVKHNISNKNLLLYVGLAAGAVILFAFLAGSPVAATTDEVPEDVKVAEQAYQETRKAHEAAKEMKAQAIILEMETGAAHCFSWKTLSYVKRNAGIEIATSIEDVEHTLCLSGDFR